MTLKNVAGWRQIDSFAATDYDGSGVKLLLTAAQDDGLPQAPITIQFDADVKEAGVIDPEAGREVRAKREWGEVPKITPKDVAGVSVPGRDVRSAPGRSPRCTIYVLGQGPNATGTVVAVKRSAPLRSHRWTIAAAGGRSCRPIRRR